MTEGRNGPEIEVVGDVEGDLVVAGRDLVTIKTIIQRLPLPVVLGLVVTLVIGLGAVAFILGRGQQDIDTSVEAVGEDVEAVGEAVSTLGAPAPTATPPFEPAAEDEVLVIVTDFRGEGLEADTRIFQALVERVASSGLEGVRIERMEGVSPLTADEAVAIGEQYGATLVIWGTADAAGMEPRYEVVRQQAIISTRPALGETPAVDLPTFNVYVTEGAPNEFEYLMLFSLGQLAFMSGDFDRTIALLDESAQVDLGERGPSLNLDTVYFLRGWAHGELGHDEAAIADFTLSIDTNSDFGPAFKFRGMGYHGQGNLEAAIADFNRAIELIPDDYFAYIERGNTYYDMGNTDAAFADYNRAIELNPDYYSGYIDRGIAYHHLGNADAAVADFTRAIELYPHETHAYYNRGLVYRDLGEDEAAIADFTRAIELHPRNAVAYYYRAGVYDSVGNTQAALADYVRFLELYGVDDEASHYARDRVEALGDG